MDIFVDLVFWFFGTMQFIGAVGGLLAWAVLLWLTCSRRGRYLLSRLGLYDEYRCSDCTVCDACEAADSGARYPCSGYVERV